MCSINNNPPKETNIKKLFLLFEKITFLKRCVNKRIILPSNDCKKIDMDLLLIQQERKLKEQIKEMEIKYKEFMCNNWKKLPQKEKNTLWKFRRIKKLKLTKKFEWLSRKQKERRQLPNYNIAYTINHTKKKNNSNDRHRYKQRKKNKKLTNLINDLNNKILNKSDINLNSSDLILLGYGLNFVPTPNWTNKVEKTEWNNLFQHIRKIEWKDYFNNEDNEEEEKKEEIKSKKLKIPKFSRPQNHKLSTETNTYIEMITNKLRNIKPILQKNYKEKNNLTGDQKRSLNNLKELVNKKKMVICRSDKDGKVVILNFTDYMKIIEKELQNYEQLQFNENSIEAELKKTKKEASNMVITLNKKGIITDNLLYLTTGYKNNKNGSLQKMTGTSAKYFDNLETGYVYPLFKTHKLEKELLNSCNIYEIPTRLVQSVGNAHLSKYTAFLEEILQPISIEYCKTNINEFCRDSKHYIESLFSWKYKKLEENESENYRLVAADVKALYPSIPRSLIGKSIKEALDTCSNLKNNGKELIISLTMHCLNNIIIQFNGKFYKQQHGIVTGDNNSVSIANIALHFIINKINLIKNNTEIFFRYIDDIMYITKDNENANNLKIKLIEEFGKYNLELTFREISTKNENEQVEFLDVLHYTDRSTTKGFSIKDFIKPTAINATFLNGKSFHPAHIFKGIIFGEAKRLRRLNEKENTYKDSLIRLREKCSKSGFKSEIMDNSFKIVNDWNLNHILPLPTISNKEVSSKNKTKEFNQTVWATSFYNKIHLNQKEKSLKPKSSIIYKKPSTIGSILCNYKMISRCNKTNRTDKKSMKCGKCGLCGNYGQLKNMVKETDTVKPANGEVIKLKQHLNCKNYGIYLATCKICGENYVGQSKNAFATRWRGHRKIWKETINLQNIEINKKNKDEQALVLHYKNNHKEKMKIKSPELSDIYNVTFLEQSNKSSLNLAENFWISKMNAKINIMKTFLPKYK